MPELKGTIPKLLDHELPWAIELIKEFYGDQIIKNLTELTDLIQLHFNCTCNIADVDYYVNVIYYKELEVELLMRNV